jgi:phospholipid/cholesterol/gamma-HCH transport system substrate-binding protein
LQIKTETKVGLFVIVAIAIFIFMLVGIGSFRFGSSGYSDYTVSFGDVSGLSVKAEVKIAGVKVGWVEDITLSAESGRATAEIMVNNKYALYDNAYAIVRQEGLIGTKYLEVIPGDPLLPKLSPGYHLTRQGREAISVDELLFKFKNIAQNVESVTSSLKDAFSGDERAEQLKATVEHVSRAAERFDSITESLEKVINGNEEAMHNIVSNVEQFSAALKDDIPALRESITSLSDTLSGSVSEAAAEVRDGFQNISAISEKINNGEGFLGKLVNEEEMYADIKAAVSGMNNYLAKFESLSVIFDSHFESMHRPVDDFKYADSKGYFNIKIHTSDSFFYLLQIATSEKGFVHRKYTYKDYYDERGNKLDYTLLPEISAQADNNDLIMGVTGLSDPQLVLAERADNKFKYAPLTIERNRNQMAFGIQFGKIYKNLALRVGLFEGAFGVGADYHIPFNTDRFTWITTLEGFDFKGQQRLDRSEAKPHLKWMNKVYVFNSFYMTFGVDDFISNNRSTFWGCGLRFGDDDIKYLLSKVGLYVAT